MLTLSIEDCFFLKTVQEGELVSLYATPCQLGRTSLAVSVEGRSLNLQSHEEWVVFRTCMRVVCVDSIGRPSPIRDRARLRIAALIERQCPSLGSGRGSRPPLASAAAFAPVEGLDGAGI